MKIKDMKFTTLVTFILILFAATYFAMSFDYVYQEGYAPGAGFMPRWGSGILLVLLIIYFIGTFKENGVKVSEVFPKGLGRKNNLITWACLIFFAVFSKKIGLILTSAIMLSVLFGINIKGYKSIVFGVVVTLCCFLVFKIILQVPVPVNKLGW